MALGKRKPVQQPLFVSTADLNVRPHPFYEAVNKVLDAHHFDPFVEELCAKFYDDGRAGGRGWRRASTSAACWSATSRASTPSAASTGGATTASRSRLFLGVADRRAGPGPLDDLAARAG